MSDIVTARLALRPITAEDVSAVLDGQRRPAGLTLCTRNQEQATYHIRRPLPGWPGGQD